MRIHHGLEPHLKNELRQIPIPLLLARLSLVTTPAANLYETLLTLFGDNPFFTLTPPRESAHIPEAGEDGIEDIPDMDTVLRFQLASCPAIRELGDAAAILPQCLDTNGRLTVGDGELASLLRIAPERVSPLLAAVQDWVDPPGLFARNLTECLLIQLRRRGENSGDAAELLRSGAEELADGGPAFVMKTLGWSKERLDAALSRLRMLDPHPGGAFGTTGRVIPEIEFVPTPDDGVRTRYLPDRLPRVLVETDLFRGIDTPVLSALWRRGQSLLLALAVRTRGRMRVAMELARIQNAAIRSPGTALLPCTLGQIARTTGLHTSTVQRISRSVWAIAPGGVMPLSRLFSRPLRSRPDMSVDRVRNEIAIRSAGGETDGRIAAELRIPVRTVAWHRTRTNRTS